MNITLGAHIISFQEKSQQIIPVAKAIPHPGFNNETITNDIMLLKVRRTPTVLQGLLLLLSPCSFLLFHPGVSAQQSMSHTLPSSPQLERKALRSKAVRPLSLPCSEIRVNAGDVCSLAGLGKMAPNGKFPIGLQEVELRV